MPFFCPECGSGSLEIARRMEFPSDCRSDEIALQIVECPGCQFLGVAVYEESRRGALDSESVDHRGYRAKREDIELLVRAMEQCPEPENPKCQCPSHRFLGETKPQGQWQRWIGLRIGHEGTFPLHIAPHRPKESSNPTAADIRARGFEWPRFAVIEEQCTVVGGRIDLAKTLQALETSRAYYQQQINAAYRFKSQTGADYRDFTDRHDDNASALHQLELAIVHVSGILAAVDVSP